jgi:hypothetical protein
MKGVSKEMVVVYFKVLYHYLPEETEKNYGNFRITGLRADN